MQRDSANTRDTVCDTECDTVCSKLHMPQLEWQCFYQHDKQTLTRTSRAVRPDRALDRPPLILLDARLKCTRSDRVDSVNGMAPLNLFSSKFRAVSLESLEMEAGICQSSKFKSEKESHTPLWQQARWQGFCQCL